MIVDSKGRYFKSLRLSVTPYCNFACTYCVDDDDIFKMRANKFNKQLNPDEFIKLISAINPFIDLYSIRITGGEPTLYKPLASLIKKLKEFGIAKVHLTTNGSLLAKIMPEIKAAGLDSINISIDALNEDIFSAMSKVNSLKQSLEGIEAAIESGIFVKLNCTVLKGINDSEILALLDYAMQKKVSIRFLELMAMGPLHSHKHYQYFIKADEILNIIQTQYQTHLLKRRKSATARYWKINQHYKFGIIANYSHPFCSDCNRLRLDSMGTLYGCLSNATGTSLTKAIENNEDIEKILTRELYKKQDVQFVGSELSMMKIGG